MQLLIYGPGRLGGAVAAAATATGWPGPLLVGRATAGGRHETIRADVVVDASVSGGVAANVEHALAAGNRAFVLATTGWDADVARVRAMLLEGGAAAVVAPNLSLGAALFLRLAETAAGWYARAGAFEPSIVEWHRRGKADRPSGTARAIARRIAAADPRWAVPEPGDDDGPGRRRRTRRAYAPRGRGHPRRRRARHPPRRPSTAPASRSSSGSPPATAPPMPRARSPPPAGSSGSRAPPGSTRSTRSSTTCSRPRRSRCRHDAPDHPTPPRNRPWRTTPTHPRRVHRARHPVHRRRRRRRGRLPRARRVAGPRRHRRPRPRAARRARRPPSRPPSATG